MSTSMVTFGGVMIETDVALGSLRADKEVMVVWVVPPAEMVGVDGLMGVTGRLW